MNTHQFLLFGPNGVFISFGFRYHEHYHAYSKTEPFRQHGIWGLFTVQWSVK